MFDISKCKDAFVVNVGWWHNDTWNWGGFGIPLVLQNSISNICLKNLLFGISPAVGAKDVVQ